MLGEYMVYVTDKPILLVCDDMVFVKIPPCLDILMANAENGFLYDGAKEHYILDIDNAELVRQVATTQYTNYKLRKLNGFVGMHRTYRLDS